jgi:hypothetical protein
VNDVERQTRYLAEEHLALFLYAMCTWTWLCYTCTLSTCMQQCSPIFNGILIQGIVISDGTYIGLTVSMCIAKCISVIKLPSIDGGPNRVDYLMYKQYWFSRGFKET